MPMIKYVMSSFLALTLIVAGPSVSVAGDSSSGEQKQKQRKTKKTPSMSARIYEKLTKAQELIEEKKYEAGLNALRAIEALPKLQNYEKAQLYNYFAYTYFTMEQYKQAINYYKKVLAQPDLPEGLQQNSLYTLAQLYFIQEDYKQAIATIKRWFASAPKPTENAYMLLGQGYYQLEDYKQSLASLQKAYKLVKERDGKPKENLLLLMRVNYFNLDDFKSMVNVLKELVVLYPKREYWLTMAGAYSELKRFDKQLAILEMLYEQGHLEKGSQQLNLANLYLLHDAPYKAAVLMDKGMGEKKIEQNIRNLRLLSQAWLLAQESKRSIPPLKQAANLSKDGDLNVRLAQAYMNLDSYKEAVASLDDAFKKGDLKDEGQAYIMQGLAQFELQKFDAAIRAFKVATKDKKNRKTAENWLQYVTAEVDRKEQLEASLKSTKVRR
ncbi:MAG: tetratricopeptide repeat protein [Gammaproteobacteria bacterium]